MILNPYQDQHYVIRRKIFKILGEAFHIYDSQGSLAFYVKQKAFKLKEDIRVFSSEDMTEELLLIKARNVIDFSATYDVIDSQNGVIIGSLRRKGMKSLLRDKWIILDTAEHEIGFIEEDNMTLAMIRRLLSNLVPQSFQGHVGQSPVLSFRQRFNPFILKMELDFSVDTHQELDRRLGIAAGILISAIEGRQQ